MSEPYQTLQPSSGRVVGKWEIVICRLLVCPTNCACGMRTLRFSLHGSVAQFDGLAMRSVAIGFDPGFLAFKHRRRIRQVLLCHETLESCQPMVVVARAIIRLAAIRRSLEFIRQRGRPFTPCEVSRADSRTARANACACQGSANTGPPSSRGKLPSIAKPSSCGIESG